jgi:hypothetical protein
MKIKTVWNVNNINFDDKVNTLLAEGWELVRREVIVDHNRLDDSVFYAELVLDDEAI